MNPYGPPKEFPPLLKCSRQGFSMEDATSSPDTVSKDLKDMRCRDLEIPIGFIATLYNQMYKEIYNRPTGQRHYTPLSVAALPPSLPAYYIPATARMNDKIKELDANIARLKELVKEDRRRAGNASGKLASLGGHDSGMYALRSIDIQSGDRKRRRTGSDDEDANFSMLRSQFRRRAESSSSEDEKETVSLLGRSRSRSSSPLNKRRHFTTGGSPSAMVGSLVSSEAEVSSRLNGQRPSALVSRGSAGLGTSFAGAANTLGLGAHPGLGSMAIESGDVFDNYRRQRSTRYHKAIAAAFQAKMGPGSDDKLCYICHQPGHFAKHCKFGIS